MLLALALAVIAPTQAHAQEAAGEAHLVLPTSARRRSLAGLAAARC